MIIKAGKDHLNKLDQDTLHIDHVVFCDCCEDEISYIEWGLKKETGLTSSYLDEMPFRKSTHYTLKTLFDIVLEKPIIEKNIMTINDKHICDNCWKTKSGDGTFMEQVRRILKLVKDRENLYV